MHGAAEGPGRARQRTARARVAVTFHARLSTIIAMRTLLASLIVIAACGGNAGSPPDGAGSGTNPWPDAKVDASVDATSTPDTPPAPDAMPPDAMPDAATSGMISASPAAVEF